jgi:hypothetical protein
MRNAGTDAQLRTTPVNKGTHTYRIHKHTHTNTLDKKIIKFY